MSEKKEHLLTASFTDGTPDCELKMPTPSYPRWLRHNGKDYVLMGLNTYAPTSRRFPTPVIRIKRDIKEKPAENEDPSSSTPRSSKT